MKLDKNLFDLENLKYDTELATIIDRIEIEPNCKTLDIGARESELSNILEKIGCEAWAVDIRDYDHPLTHFIKGDFTQVELPKNYFDVAIDVSAIHHFGILNSIYGVTKYEEFKDIDAVNKVYDCLKMGGIFYLIMDRISTNYNDTQGVRYYDVKSFIDRLCKKFFIDKMEIVNGTLYAKLIKNIEIPDELYEINGYEAHWGGQNFTNKTVLDLGADVGTSALFFINNGAKSVVCVEGNPAYYNLFERNGKNIPKIIKTIFLHITIKEDMERVLSEEADIVKIDIEGAETLLLEIPNSLLKTHKEYLIEAHSKDTYNKLRDFFTKNEFDIISEFSIEPGNRGWVDLKRNPVIGNLSVLHFRRK